MKRVGKVYVGKVCSGFVLVGLSWLCLALVWAQPVMGQPPSGAVPVAEAGVLDLRAWDFSQGTVPLYGELGFSWQALLTYFTGTWAEGFPGTDYGYATYHFTLLYPRAATVTGSKSKNCTPLTGCGLTDKKGHAGTVGTTRATRHRPQVATFTAPAGRADITVQLANFHYPGASLSFAEGAHHITIGTAAQVYPA